MEQKNSEERVTPNNNRKESAAEKDISQVVAGGSSSPKAELGKKEQKKPHDKEHSHDDQEEVEKCLELTKKWAWNSVELGARTGVLVTRRASAAVAQGGGYVQGLFAPLWLRKQAVSNVEHSLGVKQQADNDSASNASVAERLSTPSNSPRSR